VDGGAWTDVGLRIGGDRAGTRARSGQQGNPPQPAGQAAGKELPDAPGETKKESATPAQQVEDKTKQALDMTKDVAQMGFVRARDWESTWITGVFIGKNQPLITPTAKQREEIYLRQTLTTPGAYMKRMFAAGIDQARGTPRNGTTDGEDMRSGLRRAKDNLLRRIRWRRWAMRSSDMKCAMTGAGAGGWPRMRMRSSELSDL